MSVEHFEQQHALSLSYTPRVAIVTGAVQGIGYAIAQKLAESGIDIAVNDVASKSDRIDTVVEEIRALGRRAIAIPGDVSEEKEVIQMIEKTVEELGSLDIFVANAGIVRYSLFLDTTVEDFDILTKVNLRGTYLCYKYAAKQMIKQGRGGRIIGASSCVGVEGGPYLSAYGATKFGIRGLTQTAALELRKYGITVNCYAPGMIFTALTESKELAGRPIDEQTALGKKLANIHPETPAAMPSVIATTVNYLVQPDAYFVTAQTCHVDGGARPC